MSPSLCRTRRHRPWALAFLLLLAGAAEAFAQAQPPGLAVDDKSLYRGFQGGWWTRIWDVPSPANKGTRRVQVFLPPEYFSSAKRYPVIYFFHGITGWVRDAVTVREGLIPAVAKGASVPVIYVAPDLVHETMCADAKDGKIMSETFAVKELIPYIDANFRTLATPGQRALEGNSMGGFCALLYLTKYPKLFGSVTPYCPALHHAETFNSGMDAGHDLGLLVGKKMYSNDLAYAREYNPWNTWDRHLEDFKRVPIFIMTGQLDFVFARRGREFTNMLVAAGVNARFVEVPGAPHGVGQILPKLPDPAVGYAFHTANFRRAAAAPDAGVVDAGAPDVNLPRTLPDAAAPMSRGEDAMAAVEPSPRADARTGFDSRETPSDEPARRPASVSGCTFGAGTRSSFAWALAVAVSLFIRRWHSRR